MKEAMAVPKTDALLPKYGLGPAASKVYEIRQGISLGGYGEAYFGH